MKSVVDALLSALSVDDPSLSGLMDAADAVGIDTHSLVDDLESVVRERLFMWLVSHVDESLSYRERKVIIERRLLANETRLASLSVDTREELVSAIAAAQARISTARTERKSGLRQIYLVESDALLSDQGYRCAYCGVPLSHRSRRSCDRFTAGVEPLEAPVLDHVSPFYLGGNTGNYQLLCGKCNALKNDYAGVQEDGVVLSGNFLRNRRGEQTRRRMIFWTMVGSGGCSDKSCANTAKDAMLWVAKVRHSLPFVYGNLKVYCSSHAPVASVCVHDDEVAVDG